MAGDSAVRDYARECLAVAAGHTAALQAELERIRASGCKIVSGGQAGEGGWGITDWETGAVLASGTGGFGEYEKAAGELEAREGPLFHIDHLWEGAPVPDKPAPGLLPDSLAEVIWNWAEEGPAEDVAAFTGVPVDEVRAARGTP